MSELAPIVLFVYNRLDHVELTIDSLKKNLLASESILYIYSDAPKTPQDSEAVKLVRSFIREISGFKEVIIKESKVNRGLAKSIVKGVGEVVNKYGTVIVLEDDIVTSPYFLDYMNKSLNLYNGSDRVQAISGCNYPADLSGLDESTYFLRIPLCWGWATWKDKWDLFEKNDKIIKSFSRENKKILNFNFNYNYFRQAENNLSGKLDTWFIFWYMAGVNNGLLTLFPKTSLVNNIGHDASGENCQATNIYEVEIANEPVAVYKIPPFESNLALEMHIKYFNKIKVSFLSRLKKIIVGFLKNGKN